MLAKTNGWAVPLQWLARKHAGHHARIESIGLGCLARQWLLGIMLAQALWAVCASQSHGTLALQCVTIFQNFQSHKTFDDLGVAASFVIFCLISYRSDIDGFDVLGFDVKGSESEPRKLLDSRSILSAGHLWTDRVFSGSAMHPSSPTVEKRERVVAAHKRTSSYQTYKDLKTDEMPDTPRPLAHGSKRSWESSMYMWRKAIADMAKSLSE